MGPQNRSKSDRRLKAIFTTEAFLGIFFGRFLHGVLEVLGCLLGGLGFLEALLGGLWTEKRVKTLCFSRFLKRLFKAHDGPLGLILVSLVNLFWILCKNPGPKCAPKLASQVFKFVFSTKIKKKKQKKNCLFFASFFEHFWGQFWDPFWDQIG